MPTCSATGSSTSRTPAWSGRRTCELTGTAASGWCPGGHPAPARRLFGLLGPETSRTSQGPLPGLARLRVAHRPRGQRAAARAVRAHPRLKPAQIADLLEDASKEEETEILGLVHADPELEADVFEELDQDLATRLLGARTDEEIADVLARMRADDAADAIAELPAAAAPAGPRPAAARPAHQGADAAGFNATSAGGLMGMDFLAVPARATVADALAAGPRVASRSSPRR